MFRVSTSSGEPLGRVVPLAGRAPATLLIGWFSINALFRGRSIGARIGASRERARRSEAFTPLVSEAARLEHGAVTMLVEDGSEDGVFEDRARTAVLSGRADLIGRRDAP